MDIKGKSNRLISKGEHTWTIDLISNILLSYKRILTHTNHSSYYRACRYCRYGIRAYLRLLPYLRINRTHQRNVIRIDTEIREDNILLESLTLQKLHTPLVEDFYSLYTWCSVGHASRVPLHFFYLTLLISFYISHRVSVGYYSGGQHLARLWDSAMACRTHPSIRPPKCPGCLARRVCSVSDLASTRPY